MSASDSVYSYPTTSLLSFIISTLPDTRVSPFSQVSPTFLQGVPFLVIMETTVPDFPAIMLLGFSSVCFIILFAVAFSFTSNMSRVPDIFADTQVMSGNSLRICSAM